MIDQTTVDLEICNYINTATYVGDICRLYCVKLTASLERVLRVFLSDINAPRYGYDLMKEANLPSGTLYPMLTRLQDEGLLTSAWESSPDDGSGRPPRKYYRLTGEGVRTARLEIARISPSAPRGSRWMTRPASEGAQ